jgi:hypothetical protein
LADIPALMMLGQSIGDRSKRLIFSFHREHLCAGPISPLSRPLLFTPPPDGDGHWRLCSPFLRKFQFAT